ncbi:MAG: thioredoxin fold domain-containing protein [Aquificae bacterium]|nr:thioredoxin fold domain-containing protein [Aquificota bacterium]
MSFLLTLLLALFIVSCETQNTPASESPKNSAQTKTERKVIIPQKDYALLIVESKSCIYCKQLDKDIKTETALQEALKDIDLYKILYESYKPVKANFGGKVVEMSENELAKTLNALSFPNLIFYDKEGNIILQIPGYVYPTQLVCIIDFVKTEAYKNEDLNTYIKKRNCA